MYLLHAHTTQSTLSPDQICKVRELNPIFFPLPPPILMLTFSFELSVHLPKLSGFSFHECPFYKKWVKRSRSGTWFATENLKQF